MIRIIENINTNSLEPTIQKVIDKVMTPLNDNVIVTYIDKTLMPNEISVEFAWEHAPGNEEYIGSWEISMIKNNDTNYSDYLNNISAEIQTAYSSIEDSTEE